MTDTLERREAIARIIDPKEWEARDGWLETLADPELPNPERWAGRPDEAVRGSLAKADAILALFLPARSGADVETAAWAWLEKKFGTDKDDPVDRVYAADEMVDAFHAGCAAREVSGERAEAIEAAAQVVDDCNSEGPYNAIGAASRIRALATTPAPREMEADLAEAVESLSYAEVALEGAGEIAGAPIALRRVRATLAKLDRSA